MFSEKSLIIDYLFLGNPIRGNFARGDFMSDLLQTLLEHAARSCALSRAYRDALNDLRAKQTALETGLTARQRDLLENLPEAEHALHTIDAEDLFRAGISLGLELGRL